MDKEIRAYLPAHLCTFLQTGREGEILLVTSTGIYIRIEDQVFLLCDESWGVLPIGIGTTDFEEITHRFRLRQGQKVSVQEESLIFPSGRIRLVPKQLPCGTQREIIPEIAKIRQAAEELEALRKPRGISMLVQPLILGQPLEEELKANPYCMYAYPYFEKLIAAFEKSDAFEIGSCVGKLLGLGLGLTPSSDDVFLGMLFVFRALPEKCPKAADLFRGDVAQLCDQYTGQISAAYLKAIIAGAPFERMAQVLRGLCGEENLNIQMLTQIGSSSGSEMLLGMLIALRICGYDISQKERLQ